MNWAMFALGLRLGALAQGYDDISVEQVSASLALAREIERVHQFLDEHALEGDGTEGLLARVGRAIRAAYVDGQQSQR